jgi:hypothetical protein
MMISNQNLEKYRLSIIQPARRAHSPPQHLPLRKVSGICNSSGSCLYYRINDAIIYSLSMFKNEQIATICRFTELKDASVNV